MGEAWIIDAVRTPRSKGKMDSGALSGIHPQQLLATCLRGLAGRNPMEVKDVEDVIAGCVSQAGDQGACIARNAVLLAQWPQQVPGVTLNRFCGSGLQGINFAIMGIQAGSQELVVGGGVESMSHQPIGSDGGGLDGNNPDLQALHPMVPQGMSADLIATLEDFSRAVGPVCGGKPAKGRRRPGRKPLSQEPAAGKRRWGQGSAGSRGFSQAGHHRRRAGPVGRGL